MIDALSLLRAMMLPADIYILVPANGKETYSSERMFLIYQYYKTGSIFSPFPEPKVWSDNVDQAFKLLHAQV